MTNHRDTLMALARRRAAEMQAGRPDPDLETIDRPFASIEEWGRTFYQVFDIPVIVSQVRQHYPDIEMHQLDNGVWRAQCKGVRGFSSIGLTQDEAIVHAAYEAHIQPYLDMMRDMRIAIARAKETDA